jgi:hypothetical protein
MIEKMNVEGKGHQCSRGTFGGSGGGGDGGSGDPKPFLPVPALRPAIDSQPMANGDVGRNSPNVSSPGPIMAVATLTAGEVGTDAVAIIVSLALVDN